MGCSLLAAGCSRSPVVRLPQLPDAGVVRACPLPPSPDALSVVLGRFPGGRSSPAGGGAGDRLLAGYLAELARAGPRTRPDLFPSGDHLVAYLVDAHVAWAIALAENAGMAGLDVSALRDVGFPLDGGTATLRGLEVELAERAPREPRLALFLNPGWQGGPPLPESAIEGESLGWQVARQAQRCGSRFWALDFAARRLTVSGFSRMMWGLPEAGAARWRALLELVPPPAAMRGAVVSACGAALERCVVDVAPIDRSRLFRPGPRSP